MASAGTIMHHAKTYYRQASRRWQKRQPWRMAIENMQSVIGRGREGRRAAVNANRKAALELAGPPTPSIDLIARPDRW